MSMSTSPRQVVPVVGPISTTGSAPVSGSPLTVYTHLTVPSGLATTAPAATSPDVETVERQTQQLAPYPDSFTVSLIQQPRFLFQSRQQVQQDNDKDLQQFIQASCDAAHATQPEYGISATRVLDMEIQTPNSGPSATYIQQVAQAPMFRAVPYTAPIPGMTRLGNQLADNQNQTSTALSAETYRARGQRAYSLQAESQQSLPSSVAHTEISFAENRRTASVQPQSSGSFENPSTYEGNHVHSPIGQQMASSPMVAHDLALDRGHNAHMFAHQRAMSQEFPDQRPLTNLPLDNNYDMAGHAYSPTGREEFYNPPSATGYRSIHDQDGQLLSIDQRISSQPTFQQKNDCSFGDGAFSSQVEFSALSTQQLDLSMPHDSALAHGQVGQVFVGQEAMSHREPPWQPVNDFSVSRFALTQDQSSRITLESQQYLSSGPRFPYSSSRGHSYQRSFDRRSASQPFFADHAFSDLPVGDGFSVPSDRNNDPQSQQPMAFSPIVGDRGSSAVRDHTDWDQFYVSQQPEYLRSTASQQITEGSLYQPVARRPIFGFSSAAEAQAFEPLPPKRVSSLTSAYNSSVEEQDNRDLAPEATDMRAQPKQVSFALPARRGNAIASRPFERPMPALPAIHPSTRNYPVKHERLSRSPFWGLKSSNDGQYDSKPASEFWDDSKLHATSTANASEASVNFGNRYDSNNRGHGQVVSNGPLARLEPGEIFERDPFITNEIPLGRDYYHPGSAGNPTWLGQITVRYLTDNEVLFYFTVIAIMAQLRPSFAFEYGGPGRKRVSAKLTFWKHTILVDPTDSLHAAEALVCRQALEQIQGFHPKRLIPSLPKDGPTNPGWIWTKLLKDFCLENSRPKPRYKSYRKGGSWYCDVFLNNKDYHSVRGGKTPTVAENTAAHTALYQLAIAGHGNLVWKFEDPSWGPIILPDNHPLGGACLPMGQSMDTLMKNQFNTALRSNNDPSRYGSSKRNLSNKDSLKKGPQGPPRKPPNSTFWYAGVSKSVGSRKNRSISFFANVSRRTKRRRIEAMKEKQRQHANGDTVQQNQSGPLPGVANAANNVPLGNCRLSPIEELENSAEDPLEKVRSLDQKLSLLSSRSSFRKNLETICEVMDINYPEIFCGDKPNDCRAMFPYAHQLFAKFTGHPYLTRASPIKLINVNNPDPEIAQEIGVKSVILYLLKMVKDDANLSQNVYEIELPNLKRIEDETSTSLSTQNRPIGALPY